MNSIPEIDFNELQRLSEANKAKANPDRNVKSADSQLAGFFSALDAAIESAPEQPIPAREDVAVDQFLVRASNGWGDRYTRKIELTGEQWHAAFAEASDLVAGGALVALLQDRGTGKTQMAAEIARAGRWARDAGEWNGNAMVRGKTALYRRAIDIFLDLRDAQKNSSDRSEKQVLASLEACGLLVIDEFQERGGSDWENRVITNLLDKRYAAMKPTIIIANFSRLELAGALNASVRDRMHQNGKSFTFDWPSYRRNKQ